MRLGIDIRYLSHNLIGGVHTYVSHLVPALLEQGTEHQFFLYADTKSPLEIEQIPHHVQVRYLNWRVGLSSISNDLLNLRAAMAQDQIEVAHFPANYGFAPPNAKSVITLHDEINIMPWLEIIRGHPQNIRNFLIMSYLHLCSSMAIRQADQIITISEYAKGQISRYAPNFNPDHISVIYSAAEPGLQRVNDETALARVRNEYQITKPFILADALKNPAVIVRAWHRLPETIRSKYQIVFFSRYPNPLPIVFEATEAGFAQLLIRPPRVDLINLFSQTQIFVFPSWIEGFGLPLLEAMACGAPVIASDRGSIPEVAGGAAVILDAEDDSALAEQIFRLLNSPQEAAALRQHGFERAAQFSWQQTAQKVLSCYQSLI